MDWLRKLFGYKQIKCIRCKLLVWVKKNHHYLKICPKCQEKADGFSYIMRDILPSVDFSEKMKNE